MKPSKNLLEKIMTNEAGVVLTMEEIDREAELLGISNSEVIKQLFDFLIEYRFTSEGF